MKVLDSLTYQKPNGEWGIEGVDLSTLPPAVYSALRKLCDLEHGNVVVVCGSASQPVPGAGGHGGRPIRPEMGVYENVD